MVLRFLVVEKKAHGGYYYDVRPVLQQFSLEKRWTNLAIQRELLDIVESGYVLVQSPDQLARLGHVWPGEEAKGAQGLTTVFIALRITVKGRSYFHDHARHSFLTDREWYWFKWVFWLTIIGVVAGICEVVVALIGLPPTAQGTSSTREEARSARPVCTPQRTTPVASSDTASVQGYWMLVRAGTEDDCCPVRLFP